MYVREVVGEERRFAAIAGSIEVHAPVEALVAGKAREQAERRGGDKVMACQYAFLLGGSACHRYAAQLRRVLRPLDPRDRFHD